MLGQTSPGHSITVIEIQPRDSGTNSQQKQDASDGLCLQAHVALGKPVHLSTSGSSSVQGECNSTPEPQAGPRRGVGTRRALLQSCELCANKDSIAFPIALHASQSAGNMAPKLWIKRPKAGKLHKWVADREWPHIPPAAPTSLWAVFGPQAWQSHMSQGFGFSKVGREGGGAGTVDGRC